MKLNIYDQYWNSTNLILKSKININNNNKVNLSNFENKTFTEGDLSKIEIEKFTEENFDLIIFVRMDTIYIFNNTGGLLFEDNSYNLKSEYYNIIPIENNENEYNYTIVLVDP